jgi:hypothetical protein
MRTVLVYAVNLLKNRFTLDKTNSVGYNMYFHI